MEVSAQINVMQDANPEIGNLCWLGSRHSERKDGCARYVCQGTADGRINPINDDRFRLAEQDISRVKIAVTETVTVGHAFERFERGGAGIFRQGFRIPNFVLQPAAQWGDVRLHGPGVHPGM